MEDRNAPTFSRRLNSSTDEDTSISITKDLLVTYELSDSSGNIFEETTLLEIRSFEQSLHALSAWKTLCGRVAPEDRGLCDPGISLLNYKFPEMSLGPNGIVPETLNLTGQGRHVLNNMNLVLSFLQSRGLEGLVLPQDFKRSSTTLTSNTFRSAFRFRLPCCTSHDSQETQRVSRADIDARWELFVAQAVSPFVRQLQDDRRQRQQSFWIWYDGTEVYWIELMRTLRADYTFAVGAMLFVMVYMPFHTGSILLSLAGPVISLLSVPLTYVLYAFCANINQINFVNLLSLFLVTGFGADILFIYIDFWAESKTMWELTGNACLGHIGVPYQLPWRPQPQRYYPFWQTLYQLFVLCACLAGSWAYVLFCRGF
jgi:hypothetical protein